MRPVAVPDALPGRPRKPSFPDAATLTPNSGPTTYFLAKEEEMDDNDADMTRSDELQKSVSTEYGVESLEETIAGSSDEGKALEEDNVERSEESTADRRRSTIKAIDHVEDSPMLSNEPSRASSKPRLSPQIATSQPLTPLFLASPDESSSTPSSPKSTSTRSFRHLDDEHGLDETGSQAITSGEDEEEIEMPSEIQDSAPQLIMPSIKMPSRRPFTQRGRNIGRFKVLIAGNNGTGKTSLIKSIVQVCEDIVHVDSLSPTYTKIDSPQSKKGKGKIRSKDINSTRVMTEIFASTRSYPAPWSDFEDSRILQRRKSMGDAVLERNLCFVDSPGCRHDLGSGSDGLEPILNYMESQLNRSISALGSSDADMVSLLSGNGGWQVDAVLFLVSESTLSSDLTSIKRLSELTSVIPVIAKIDLMSKEEIRTLKESFDSKVIQNGIRVFWPEKLEDESAELEKPEPGDIFAVSSANSDDAENMDASLLMSADYVQPLIPSELNILVHRLLDRDTISWLRHCAAKKLLQYQRSHPVQPDIRTPYSLRSLSAFSPSGLASPLSSPSNSQVLVSYTNINGTDTYTLARVADHTQREQKLAQMQLATWATDLKRSLENERERYEALARADRAVWLTEKLGECVVDGTLVPINQTPAVGTSYEIRDKITGALINPGQRQSSTKAYYGVSTIDRYDPLGVMKLNEKMKRRGWVTLQVLGGFGMVGGLALWIAKSWGNEWEWGWHWGWDWAYGFAWE